MPVQRDTRYRVLRSASAPTRRDDPLEPARRAWRTRRRAFGTYASVARDERYRFKLADLKRRSADWSRGDLLLPAALSCGL